MLFRRDSVRFTSLPPYGRFYAGDTDDEERRDEQGGRKPVCRNVNIHLAYCWWCVGVYGNIVCIWIWIWIEINSLGCSALLLGTHEFEVQGEYLSQSQSQTNPGAQAGIKMFVTQIT